MGQVRFIDPSRSPGQNPEVPPAPEFQDFNGAVFITDILPQDPNDSVGAKQFSSDGQVLELAASNTNEIIVHVLAFSGHRQLIPQVRVNGLAVDLDGTEDRDVFEGEIPVNVQFNNGETEIEVTHNDGPTRTVRLLENRGPSVVSATFVNGYPGNQTELKEGDTFDLRIEATVGFTEIEVEDFGACFAQNIILPNNNIQVFPVEIADRGNNPQLLPCRFRLRDRFGIWGPFFTTDSVGNEDGVHLVNCNNRYPSFAFEDVSYPDGQQALKNNEEALVAVNVQDADIVNYSSPNGELTIINPNEPDDEAIGSSPKRVRRLVGDYNINNFNLRVDLTRVANGAEFSDQTVINIAHQAAQLQIFGAENRLRSGGNQGTAVQRHPITIRSDQDLIQAPQLEEVTGNFDPAGFNGGPQEWTNDLLVHDQDPKGVQVWGEISGINLAGIETNAIAGDNQYELGGFVSRTIQVQAWPNREADLGTNVSDTTKLRCENLSKGGDGPNGGSLFNYSDNIGNTVNEYTITSPVGVFNPSGNNFYNKDLANAVSNVGGLAEILIEEDA